MHGMGENRSDVPGMVLLPELLYRHAFSRPFFEQQNSWTRAANGLPILGEEGDLECGHSRCDVDGAVGRRATRRARPGSSCKISSKTGKANT
jgi:hypothetical protein